MFETKYLFLDHIKNGYTELRPFGDCFNLAWCTQGLRKAYLGISDIDHSDVRVFLKLFVDDLIRYDLSNILSRGNPPVITAHKACKMCHVTKAGDRPKGVSYIIFNIGNITSKRISIEYGF